MKKTIQIKSQNIALPQFFLVDVSVSVLVEKFEGCFELGIGFVQYLTRQHVQELKEFYRAVLVDVNLLVKITNLMKKFFS